MPVVIPSTAVRDVLYERLRAVFSSTAFRDLYAVKEPAVSLGFPASEPPFYVAVDEICDTAQTSGATSTQCAGVSFTVHVWCFAEHRELKVAADTLMAYVDVVIASVVADHTLGMSVDNAMASILAAGTAANGSKRHSAAATVDITCETRSACPKEIKEVIDGIESN